MDRLTRVLALLVTLAAACSSGGSATTSTTAPGRLVPPVIEHSFTQLSCDHTSQLGEEGCALRELVRTDRQIDALAATVFHELYSNAARRRFLVAEQAWLRYRQLTCTSRGDVHEGGTLASLDSVLCTADLATAHLDDLQQFHASFAEPTG